MSQTTRVSLRSDIPSIIARVDAGAEPALDRSAARIRDVAIARVPVGAPTLHIRNTIRVRGVGDSREVTAGSRRAFYGHFIEWGTIHVHARPFMRPAAEVEEASGKLLRDIEGLFK